MPPRDRETVGIKNVCFSPLFKVARRYPERNTNDAYSHKGRVRSNFVLSLSPAETKNIFETN